MESRAEPTVGLDDGENAEELRDAFPYVSVLIGSRFLFAGPTHETIVWATSTCADYRAQHQSKTERTRECLTSVMVICPCSAHATQEVMTAAAAQDDLDYELTVDGRLEDQGLLLKPANEVQPSAWCCGFQGNQRKWISSSSLNLPSVISSLFSSQQ